MSQTRLQTVFAIAWIATVSGGFFSLWTYGKDSVPADLNYPAGGQPGRWSLQIAIHPQCPCTQATVSELERVLSRVGDRVRCEALVLSSPNDPRFTETALVKRLRKTAGVVISPDRDGERALTAGLDVSGEVLLRDASGRVRFAGGITPARGHEGGNLGSTAVLDLVAGRPPVVTSTPVYGCRLQGVLEIR